MKESEGEDDLSEKKIENINKKKVGVIGRKDKKRERFESCWR